MDSYVPVRIAYDSFKPVPLKHGEGRSPVIFLHGMFSCKETWHSIPQSVADATKREVYTLDIRNHGDSEWSDNFVPDDLVQDVLSFMDSIRAMKVILVGHSMGGVIAMNLALREPDRVELLVVEDMFRKNPPQCLVDASLAGAALLRKCIALVPADIDEEAAKDNIIKFATAARHNQVGGNFDTSTIALKRKHEGGFALKANMPVLEESLRKSTDHAVHKEGIYDGPVCFIYGKLSPFEVPKDADNIRKYFPKATFVGVDNSSHSVHRDNQQVFVKELLNFVTKNVEIGEDQEKKF